MTKWSILVTCIALLTAAPSRGQEFRRINEVPAPELRPQPKAEQPFRPVAQETVEGIVKQLFSAWNTPMLRALLGPAYYDQDRLQDTLAKTLPRDARLRILAIESMSTLRQSVRQQEGGQPPLLISTVAVVVRSQLEYNDPVEGFVRLDGTNEYVLRVVEELTGESAPTGR